MTVFSYPTTTINGNDYNLYVDPSDAVVYLAAAIGSAAVAWSGATNLVKDQSLVAATRWLDAGHWQGQMTDSANPLQWPRTGLTYPNGQAVDANSLPQALQNACCELAAQMVDNPDLRDQLQDPTPRTLRAGSVDIEFFRPPGVIYGAKDVQVLSFFPTVVMNLVGFWLGGGPASTSPVRTKGTHRKSPLDDDFGFIHGI
jgi:hypothetical protein